MTPRQAVIPAAVLVSAVFGDRELDEAAVHDAVDTALNELHADQPTVAAAHGFLHVIDLLLNELALTTGRTRADVWSEIAVKLAASDP